jgi:guanine deaminase
MGRRTRSLDASRSVPPHALSVDPEYHLSMTTTAIRSSLLHCLRDPGLTGDSSAIEYFPDAITLLREGKIERVGPTDALLPSLGADVQVADHRGQILLPGFIDTHVHYPQMDVIASCGTQLLDWLNRYTFPAEIAFADRAHADAMARFFLDRLLENGTTTASVFCTVHPQSVDAFFAESEARGLRMIAGKCLMDQNAPDGLRDTAASGYADTKALIERWHGHARSSYAITPRFAPTSSVAQMETLRTLAREHPTAYIQSHVAENKAEIEWVATLFPDHRSYLDVYDHYGLLRERSIYAHCIYLDDADRARMTASGATPAFCPTSNLFIGSGLYDLKRALDAGNQVSLGTQCCARWVRRTRCSNCWAHQCHPPTHFIWQRLAGLGHFRLTTKLARSASAKKPISSCWIRPPRRYSHAERRCVTIHWILFLRS